MTKISDDPSQNGLDVELAMTANCRQNRFGVDFMCLRRVGNVLPSPLHTICSCFDTCALVYTELLRAGKNIRGEPLQEVIEKPPRFVANDTP